MNSARREMYVGALFLAACAVWSFGMGVYGVAIGETGIGHRGLQATLLRSESPVLFWFVSFLWVAVAAMLTYLSVRVFREARG